MEDIIAARKVDREAKIKPDSRVANEDYYRACKENTIMKELQKRQTEKTMARTRFDEKPAQPIGIGRTAAGDGDGDQQADLLISAVNNRNKNPHTVKYIDPNLDPRLSIHRI